MPPPCRPRSVALKPLRLLSLASALGLATAVSLPPSSRSDGRETEAGDGGPISLPLECRIGSGAWRPCRMRVEEVGMHWYLLIGDQQVEFRHDGRGVVRVRQQGAWRSVSSRWEADSSLCWDGYCARGDIPLD